jgi:hypothetical protein
MSKAIQDILRKYDRGYRSRQRIVLPKYLREALEKALAAATESQRLDNEIAARSGEPPGPTPWDKHNVLFCALAAFQNRYEVRANCLKEQLARSANTAQGGPLQ